jgi:hypothetical protein
MANDEYKKKLDKDSKKQLKEEDKKKRDEGLYNRDNFAAAVKLVTKNDPTVQEWDYGKRMPFEEKFKKMLSYFAEWPPISAKELKAGQTSQLKVREVLASGLLLGNVPWRLLRICTLFILFFLLAVILVTILGFPRTPSRGRFAFWVTFVTFVLSEPVVLLLMILYIYDVATLTHRFLQWLSSNAHRVQWPEHLFPNTYIPAESKLKGTVLDFNNALGRKIYEQYYQVCLTADATIDIATILPYPFMILAILFVSQTPFFDDWRWSSTQIILMGLSLSAILITAYFMQRAARHIRSLALKTLDKLLLTPNLVLDVPNQFKGEPMSTTIKELAGDVRSKIQSIETGAYLPLSKNPIVSAILIPATSIGASYGAPELVKWFSNWL